MVSYIDCGIIVRDGDLGRYWRCIVRLIMGNNYSIESIININNNKFLVKIDIENIWIIILMELSWMLLVYVYIYYLY